MTLSQDDRMAADADAVWLDDGGLLHVGRSWVALPDTEWRVVAALLSHFGELVGRDELTRAAWPTKGVSEGALNVIVKRVRHRLVPLGLTITTVRGRGFVIDTVGPAA
jgi:two-component system, OmpR family, response regulator